MLYLRVLLLAASLVAATVFGYFYLFSDGESELAKTQELFLRGDNREAQRLLEKSDHRIPFPEQQLFSAYLARANGQMDVSDRYLAEAADCLKDTAELNVLMEVSLNQMLNAYLNGDSFRLGSLVEEMRRLTGKDTGWIALFSGLEAYYNQDYERAIETVRLAKERGYSSPVMEKVFREYFPLSWEELFIARCRIEQGNWNDVRQQFEGVAEEQAQPNFLLGLSYVKEGEAQSYDEAIPYYRLAFRYFDRVPIKEGQFRQDRERILSKIREKTYVALREKSYEELDFYATLLDRWGDCEGARKLEGELVNALEKDLAMDRLEQLEGYAVVLAYLLEEGTIRDNLERKLLIALEEAVEEGQFETVTPLWRASRLLSRDSDRLAALLADRAIKRVFLGIHGDDARLTQTGPYLNFWSQVAQDSNYRYQITVRLIALAEEMWQHTKNREKAVQMLRLAQTLPIQAHQRFIREKIEKTFQQIHQTALHQDDTAELHDLYKAVVALELAEVDLYNTQDQAQLMEEARRLYQEQRYEEANQKAQWVYKLDPENVEVKILLGRIAYSQFEYSEAYRYLKEITSSNSEVMKEQGVVFILEGQDKEGKRLLEKAAKESAIDEEVYLRLGFGLLAQGKPVAASQWLEEVENHPQAVLAGRCFVAFEMQSWSETVDLESQLSYPYSALDGFQGIAVESLIALGKIGKAEEELNLLLFSPPEPRDLELPEYFQAFKKERLDHWNRNYVAGNFYRVVKDDPEKALQYFDKIDDLLPLAELGKAELLMDAGRNDEARKSLLLVLRKIQGSKGERRVKIRLLPILAAIQTRLGYFAEAWTTYREYFSLQPQDNTYRADFAKVLMRLRRFDLAFEQYRKLKSSFDLRPLDMIAFIECMIHTDRFDLANKTAVEMLNRQGEPLSYQLQLARLMVITNNRDIVNRVMRISSAQERLTIEEEKGQIRIWTQMANYGDALALARFRERELLETVEGLKALVELYLKQSRFDKAMYYAERLSELTPADSVVADLREQYEREPDVIAQSVKLLKGKLEDEPGSITLRLDLAADLVDLAIASYSAGDIDDIQTSLDLRKARTLLLKVTEKTRGLPEVYYQLGKVYYLLGKDTKAKEAYEEALRLDVSYGKAYQYLALVYEGSKEYDKAIALLRRSVRFDPNNAELWEQLGSLYTDVGKYAEAIAALRQAIRFMPNEAKSYIRMADVYLQKKDPEESVVYLEQALDLSPRDMEAIKLMLLALHDPKYISTVGDSQNLTRQQLLFFDKLQALDPQEADTMRERLGVESPARR